MEIKTTNDIIDWWEESDNTDDELHKRWIAVDDMIKELSKYHNGLHPKCNICKLIEQLVRKAKKE